MEGRNWRNETLIDSNDAFNVCSIAPAYRIMLRMYLCVKMIGKMHYPENLEAICNRDKVKCQKLVDNGALDRSCKAFVRAIDH